MYISTITLPGGMETEGGGEYRGNGETRFTPN